MFDSLGHAVRKAEGAVDDPQLAGVNLLSAADRTSDPPGTDKVIRRAEKQAEKSKRKGASEDDVPDRSISAVRSPDAERSDLITLPVIGEAAESGSATSAAMTPQRSKESLHVARDSEQSHRPQHIIVNNAGMSRHSLGEVPPPTPPKSDGQFSASGFERGRLPDRPPPTPPKDDRDLHRTSTSSSLDKALPRLPVPQVNNKTSAPSARGAIGDDEVENLRSRIVGLAT